MSDLLIMCIFSKALVIMYITKASASGSIYCSLTGAFLFGMLMTMIFTDVTKIMVGRLRPTFLDICKPNTTLCGSATDMVSGTVCTEKDEDKIRDAR